jgi:hypothetical protein
MVLAAALMGAGLQVQAQDATLAAFSHSTGSSTWSPT